MLTISIMVTLVYHHSLSGLVSWSPLSLPFSQFSFPHSRPEWSFKNLNQSTPPFSLKHQCFPKVHTTIHKAPHNLALISFPISLLFDLQVQPHQFFQVTPSSWPLHSSFSHFFPVYNPMSPYHRGTSHPLMFQFFHNTYHLLTCDMHVCCCSPPTRIKLQE